MAVDAGGVRRDGGQHLRTFHAIDGPGGPHTTYNVFHGDTEARQGDALLAQTGRTHLKSLPGADASPFGSSLHGQAAHTMHLGLAGMGGAEQQQPGEQQGSSTMGAGADTAGPLSGRTMQLLSAWARYPSTEYGDQYASPAAQREHLRALSSHYGTADALHTIRSVGQGYPQQMLTATLSRTGGPGYTSRVEAF